MEFYFIVKRFYEFMHLTISLKFAFLYSERYTCSYGLSSFPFDELQIVYAIDMVATVDCLSRACAAALSTCSVIRTTSVSFGTCDLQAIAEQKPLE